MNPSGPVGSPNRTSPDLLRSDQPEPAPQTTAAAVAYDRHIAPFAKPFALAAVEALLDTTRPSELKRLLDHGSGTGQVARLLHHRLPHSTIHCLDPSADLLHAAPRAPEDPWATCQQGTALHLPADEQFDGCVSNLVLPFTADTTEDLRCTRASLRTGAPLVAVTLGTATDVEPFQRFWTAYASIGPYWVPERYVHFRFGDPAALRNVFEAAGFANIRLTTVEATRTMSPEAAWEWLSSALPVGSGEGYETPSDDDQEAARCEFFSLCNGRTTWSTRCLLAIATA